MQVDSFEMLHFWFWSMLAYHGLNCELSWNGVSMPGLLFCHGLHFPGSQWLWSHGSGEKSTSPSAYLSLVVISAQPAVYCAGLAELDCVIGLGSARRPSDACQAPSTREIILYELQFTLCLSSAREKNLAQSVLFHRFSFYFFPALD